MEDKYVHTADGQEVNESDINLIAAEAALADDHVFRELFRMPPSTSGTNAGSRGVLGANRREYATGQGQSALLVPSGSSDARVYVAPFRAYVTLPDASASGSYTKLRSAICMSALGITAGAAGGPLGQALQFPAATNNRWDLVYVRLDADIDGASVNRFQKTGSTPATLVSVPVTKRTVATLAVVQGTEATSPTRPSIPADSGSAYYIPIAYVLLLAGHTLTTAIPSNHICEWADVHAIDPATGAASLAIANGSWNPLGVVEAGEQWTVSNGRPTAYLPPTMGGKRELVFALTEISGRFTIALGATGILDDSIDWRRRLFKATAVADIITADAFPWTPTASPMFQGTRPVYQQMAQSFTDTGGVSTTGKAYLLHLNPSSTGAATAASSTVDIYVDLADGKLKCDISATSPAAHIIVWLEATGQFNNAL